MASFEVNFDGLVGPTHHYAGLSFGNIASTTHRHQPSNPRAAALQGLEKMQALARLGLKQALLPPQPRPDWQFFRKLGFSGNLKKGLKEAARVAPQILSSAYSAASMWAANAATVSPSVDSIDERLHLTCANLVSTPHRAMEADKAFRILSFLFRDVKGSRGSIVHRALPASLPFADEGAANHIRLCADHGSAGLEVFVYGRDTQSEVAAVPGKFPARQTLQACQSIARLHRLEPKQFLFAQQNPIAIDQGVFHNDVVSVGNENVLLYHSQAFEDSDRFINDLSLRFSWLTKQPLIALRIDADELSLSDAVSTYLFNSQLVTLRPGYMALICPEHCRIQPQAKASIDRLIAGENPIREVHYFDLKQSMMNGGGPACLRLRVVLEEEQWSQVHAPIKFNESLHQRLRQWVEKHYRESLTLDDLADLDLAYEVHRAMSELEQILAMPSGMLAGDLPPEKAAAES
jgi:succinylarginine dihydrolase